MAAELHLPDLPEVPLHVGGPGGGRARRAALPWRVRLRDALASALPLLIMAVLALASWWLVRNAPAPLKPPVAEPQRKEPDYTMQGFVLERYEPGGRLKARLQGEQMRHFPDTDRIEIDGLRLEAFAPDGRVTTAQAAKALSNGDASEVQLSGQAQVHMLDARGEAIHLSSEFLHLFAVTERVQTHRPVLVQRGAAEFIASGMRYDHARGLLELQGAQRAVLPPRGTVAAH